jgi:multidrug efflux pump subunit AcrA (membrane-fusion protein)
MSVTAGQPLVDLVKSGPLKLRLNAPSRWLGQLKTGLAFEVAIEETGKRYPARVSAVNSRVDSVSQTVELEATLAGSYPELLPGMSGTAVFPPR